MRKIKFQKNIYELMFQLLNLYYPSGFQQIKVCEVMGNIKLAAYLHFQSKKTRYP